MRAWEKIQFGLLVRNRDKSAQTWLLASSKNPCLGLLSTVSGWRPQIDFLPFLRVVFCVLPGKESNLTYVFLCLVERVFWGRAPKHKLAKSKQPLRQKKSP